MPDIMSSKAALLAEAPGAGPSEAAIWIVGGAMLLVLLIVAFVAIACVLAFSYLVLKIVRGRSPTATLAPAAGGVVGVSPFAAAEPGGRRNIGTAEVLLAV